MGDRCTTTPCTESDNEEDFEDIEGKNVELDFGTLEIFKERTKFITFCRPMIEEDIVYSIKKSYSMKSIKTNFLLDHLDGVLKPNQDFKMAVTYTPTIPSVKDVEVYHYTDDFDNDLTKIVLCGKALGPHCKLSVKRLEFYKTPGKHFTQKKVEIINDSRAVARFKIEHPDNDCFHVEPQEGAVKANCYQYLTVKFQPRKPGVFARNIFCLIWNSELLVLDVVGIHSTEIGIAEVRLNYFSSDPSLSFGFKAYLDDSLTVRKKLPAFSLTSQYLDFGCVLYGGKQPRTQVTSLTNHLNIPIFVDWDRGNKPKVFKITPDHIKILPMSSVHFEVEFNPEENYNVYQETMIAQVDWRLNMINKSMDANVEPNVFVPLTCTLRVQGHSFPDNEGWIAQVKVLPEVVYWAPCAPGELAYTTFCLQNKSHLPVLYQLIPPKKTNVIAKPMMGKFRNREIIVVQLQTEALKVRTYIEEWKIITNGEEGRPITIYFHGETCVPTIQIGNKNKINAGSVQDGSQKEIQVMMRNTSYYAMCYNFRLIPNSIINILPMSGTLPANDTKRLTMRVKGIECAPKTETFICESRIIDGHGAVAGGSHEIEIELSTHSAYSQLCACPSFKDFGRHPFGRRIKSDFQVFNFGDTPIFFQATQCGDKPDDRNFRIKPYFGEIRPKECKGFSIYGIISEIGTQTLEFGYYNRMVKDSPLVTGEPITLYVLTYSSEFPIIQVEEIVEHNFGSLFGKIDFYQHYFQISRLNEVLRSIQQNQTLEFHSRLPEFQVQEKEFYVKLALINCTDFDTTVSIQRKKICDCALEEMSAGMSERKKGFNCPHRATLNMELEDKRFDAQTIKFLTITIKYCLEGDTTMCYSMQMSNNRVVNLFFQMYAIPPNTPRLSTFNEEFEMMLKDVYLGTRVAPVQMYWMYNNTDKLLNVEFDTNDIEHMCRIDGFNVLKILNPVDQIPPFQRKALLVKFHPIEMKTYSIGIDVKYYFPGTDGITSRFLIEGQGVMYVGNQLLEFTSSLPRVGRFICNFPVSLSLEFIEVKMLPVWSRRTELIFIKNTSRGKVVQYIWSALKIDDVLEISTDTQFSMLQPKEIQPVVITIKSFSQPCIATLLLPCEVVCYSDEVVHQITKEKERIAENRINEFMFGEPSWAKRPENPVKVHPKPETVHASVTISITTVHTKDLDQNMDTSLQIRQFPNQSIENIPKSLLKRYYPEKPLNYPEKEKLQPSISINERDIFCRVLEEVVTDVVFSDFMKTLLEKSTKTPLHKYNQFVMDDKTIMEKKLTTTPLSNQDIENYRKEEVEHFLNQLKVTEISNILQTLIYESILKVAKCQKPSFDVNDIQDKIEKGLYVCRHKNCDCGKH